MSTENRTGIQIETDPEGDARKAVEKNETERRGVKFVGGGQHDKMERGVKRVSRNKPS